MAKSTAAEAAITRQKIIEMAVEITLYEGFEFVTLGELAKRIGMSRSGINAHFPKKQQIAEAIRPIIAKILYEQISLESPDEFYQSWVEGIDKNSKFVAAARSLGPIAPSGEAFEALIKKIKSEDKQKTADAIYRAFGYAVVHIEDKFKEIQKEQ